MVPWVGLYTVIVAFLAYSMSIPYGVIDLYVYQKITVESMDP